MVVIVLVVMFTIWGGLAVFITVNDDRDGDLPKDIRAWLRVRLGRGGPPLCFFNPLHGPSPGR